MTDGPETASTETFSTDVQPVAASAGVSVTADSSAAESGSGIAAEHPELIVGGAFAGGLLLAMILKRLAD